MPRIIIIVISILCYWSSAQANITHVIQEEINKVAPHLNIGIKIRNLKNNKVIYAQNVDRYYTFASSLKLITILSLQQYFGIDHNFVSRIIKDNNDYYLDIQDPDFLINDLDFLISMVKQTGVNEIQGNFYIINHTFTIPAVTVNKMVIDGIYCYGAPVTKVHVNKNCTRIVANAADTQGNLIKLTTQELIPYNLINKAVTVLDQHKAKVNINIVQDQLIVDGTLNQASGKITIGAVVNDNLAHVRLMLAKILNQYNITVTGEILLGHTPATGQELVKRSKNFAQIASSALKNSDNYITDYLFAEYATDFAKDDWRDTGVLLKQLVFDKFKVDLKNSVIVDGSGLSRYNMLTVTQFDSFLTALYRQNNFKSLMMMLARAGEDGSLINRFKGVQIFAKTGGMSGVSSLAGYVFDRDNTPYSFVIVSNNYIESKKRILDLEEAIIRAVIK
ncbi:D-alanyl-D-alanine carboxypeptidase/D-alanyl-D-alanine endopeptidase [Candidatus Trichorickettsia mobilis]|uniref:D-alanyl-D-alanine carboxypeptidase/D-alanyl-D-alanine endopeptidase n=1 Tax=Candidatus Trichorickettsia mobilis TaxID=1346319 RepID=UPI00292F8074|nr:D-alanyl-D-alanine carboxypeptidase/D-alanyl-D-alanine-endopeptidase [Candidatus Trichorickettsia mobilis]